jgi:hypothetical protein
VSFAHTVLVDMRERLRRSADPDRVFTVALAAAHEAGLVGPRRVLDSTPLREWRCIGDFRVRPRQVVAVLAPEDDQQDLRTELEEISKVWAARPILDPPVGPRKNDCGDGQR